MLEIKHSRFVVKLLLFVVSGGVQGERLISKCKLKGKAKALPGTPLLY